jgi:hypothetical protein
MEDGKYRARGVTAAMGKTEGGKPQVAVEFEFLDHPGVRLPWYGSFAETTVGQDQKPLYQITMESLYHCGWEGPDLRDLTGIDRNEVSVVVANEEYQGKTRPKIKWVNAAGGGLIKNEMASDELSGFAAKMKGAALSTRKNMRLPDPAAKPKANGQQQKRREPPPGSGDAYEDDSPPDWMND